MGDAAVSADDCVQEAFLVYYNKLLSGEDILQPRAFLYRTADNFLKQAVDRYAKDLKRTVPLESAESVTSYDLPFDPSDLDYEQCAEALLQSLRPEEQELYRLKYVEHQSLSEIAKMLSISPAAAAKRTSRLRSTVKAKLTETIHSQRKGGI